MSNSEPYSTLEVRNSSQLPEVVDPEQFQKEFVAQQPVPGQYAANGAYNNPYPPAEGYYAHGIPQSAHSGYEGASTGTYQGSPAALYDANAAKMAYGQTAAHPGEHGLPPVAEMNDEKKAKRKICGVAPLTFYIILGVLLAIIVAAVVGGVVGSRNSGSGDDANEDGQESSASGSSGNTTTAAPGEQLIRSGSRLTSSNWTDPDGIVHRAVFFQDVYDNIIVRQWDAKDKTWQTTNISDQLAPSTMPLKPMSGTALASAAIDDEGLNAYEVHLWYLDPDAKMKSVARLQATDSSNRWKTDTLNDALLEARPGSLLSATWQRPWDADGTGNWIVAYQRPSDGAVKTANSSHWDVSDVAVESDFVVDNSSLAIIPQLHGSTLDGARLVSQGLGRDSGSMQLSTFDGTWNTQDRDILIGTIPDPSRTQHFAATMWDNWSNYLYLALLDGGEMAGSHYDGSKMNSLSEINFSGGPDRDFEAISMTTDAMLYAISNDEILEYSVDTSFPSNLRFVGKVFPDDE